MAEISVKTFEQEAWSARAAHWLDDAARATALAAPRLLAALAVEPRQAVLDLCCGPGVVAGAAHGLGAEVTGVDFAPAMIAKARERLPELDFMIGDAEALDVRENEFDAIACNFGMQHLAHPEQAMREAFRALKPGGRFAWTHWLSPKDSPLTHACAEALALHGAPELRDEALEERAYRLAEPAAAAGAMRRAGFREVETETLSLEVATPAARLTATAHALFSRAPLAIDRQPDAAKDAIAAHLRQTLMAADASETSLIALKAPALLCLGVKPAAQAVRPGRFGIVKKLLQSTPKTDGA